MVGLYDINISILAIYFIICSADFTEYLHPYIHCLYLKLYSLESGYTVVSLVKHLLDADLTQAHGIRAFNKIGDSRTKETSCEFPFAGDQLHLLRRPAFGSTPPRESNK
jgi:hypothetical protein